MAKERAAFGRATLVMSTSSQVPEVAPVNEVTSAPVAGLLFQVIDVSPHVVEATLSTS